MERAKAFQVDRVVITCESMKALNVIGCTKNSWWIEFYFCICSFNLLLILVRPEYRACMKKWKEMEAEQIFRVRN